MKTTEEDSTKIEEIREQVNININLELIKNNTPIAKPKVSLWVTTKNYLRKFWEILKETYYKMRRYFLQFKK